MGEVIKSPIIVGLTGKLEGSYGAGGMPSASTDGIQLADTADITLAYGFDGARAAPPGTRGYQRRTKPSGRTGTVPFKTEVKGAGAAYSSSVRPSVDVLARICALDAALTTTPGAEKVVYTPTPGPNGYASAVFNAYSYGQLWPLTAAYGELEIAGDDTGIVYATATVQALVGAISDQLTPPAITYPLDLVDPLVSAGASLFTIGSFVNAVMRTWKLKTGNSISPRKNQNNAAGHAGFAIGRRTPTLEVSFEMPALTGAPFHSASALDPYNLFDAASQLAWAITLPGVQYNRSDLSGPAAQVMAPPVLKNDNDVAVVTLQLQLNPSAANANDEFAWKFD